jgi:hypothetical protein
MANPYHIEFLKHVVSSTGSISAIRYKKKKHSYSDGLLERVSNPRTHKKVYTMLTSKFNSRR